MPNHPVFWRCRYGRKKIKLVLRRLLGASLLGISPKREILFSDWLTESKLIRFYETKRAIFTAWQAANPTKWGQENSLTIERAIHDNSRTLSRIL
jgi:hypothetical protein